MVLALVLVSLVAAAWLWQTKTETPGATTAAPGVSVYSITVYNGSRFIKRFTLTDLRRLAQTSFTWEGKAQNGPALATVLKAAGIGGYASLAIKGMGLYDSGHLTLTAAQAAAGVVVAFNQRGTTKICGPKLSRDAWVRDVTEIHVD